MVNNMLSDDQKACIKGIPFGWLLMVDRDLQMRRMFVRKLCCRFVEKNYDFKIRSQVFSVTLIDGCIGIGLRIAGEKVDLEKKSSVS